MPSKRLGRGYGSGVGGHTVGRGTKGQKSRSGHKSTLFFEGGNVNLYRRLPKYRGFKRTNKVYSQPVNLSVIEANFNTGDSVNVEILKEKGLVRKNSQAVKILSLGDITKAISFSGVLVSEAASKKIVDAGGTVK